MEYEQLALALEKMGMRVERGNISELVVVKKGGIVQCPDGRTPSTELQPGPKIIGGIEGLAWFYASEEGVDVEERHIERAIIIAEKLGWKPGVHDMHKDPHCGHAKKVLENAFSIGTNVEPDRVAEMVIRAGGVNSHLLGEHEETRVGINLNRKMTRNPNSKDQAFHVDVGIAEDLGLKPMDMIGHSAATVKLLRPDALKIIRIYS